MDDKHFAGYTLGILHAIEHLVCERDEPTTAKEMRDGMLQGISDEELQSICKREDVRLEIKYLDDPEHDSGRREL